MSGYGWRGCAIAERFRSDSTPSPILQPQSDTKGHKTYVLFVWLNNDPPSHLRCFGAVKRKQTMKLNEAIKGMEVKSWERRENSNGKCTVYVRFVPKSSAPTVSVKEVA